MTETLRISSDSAVLLLIAFIFMVVRFFQLKSYRGCRKTDSDIPFSGSVTTLQQCCKERRRNTANTQCADRIFTRVVDVIESRFTFDYKDRLIVVERERSVCKDTLYVYINDESSKFWGSPCARGYPIARVSIHILTNESFITLTHGLHRSSDVFLTDNSSVERLIGEVKESIEERALNFAC